MYSPLLSKGMMRSLPVWLLQACLVREREVAQLCEGTRAMACVVHSLLADTMAVQKEKKKQQKKIGIESVAFSIA